MSSAYNTVVVDTMRASKRARFRIWHNKKNFNKSKG